MTFSENNSLLPGGSVSASEVKKLNEKIDNLSQTVTSVADSVSALSNEVNTSSLNASNAVIDNATIGFETVTSADITSAEIDSADITDADITNADVNDLTADNASITDLTVSQVYANSVNSASFTGQSIHVSENIQSDKKLLGASVEATNAKFTNAEVTDVEIKGDTTVRGDVHFPENGDKIYGEYLDVEANNLQAKSLTTVTPSDSSQLVGYDNNGKLIPIDASLEPANLWEKDPDEENTIRPKDEKNIKTAGIFVDGDTNIVGNAKIFNNLNVIGDTTIGGTLQVDGDIIQNGSATFDSADVTNDATVGKDLTVGGDLNAVGDTRLTDTTIDGTLQVNGRDTNIVGNARIFQDLDVGGDTTLAKTTIGGTLQVDGDIIQNGRATFDSADVTNDATVGKDLIVGGALNAVGDTTIVGNARIWKTLIADGDTTIVGNARIWKTLIADGDTTIGGTLQVNGDIIQNGSAYETHAEKVYTKNDLIITRDGAVGALGPTKVTGIQAKKYDGTNDGQLVFDRNGEARVGDVGNTEPLLTRDELANMTDARPLVWDGTNSKAVTGTSGQADALNSGITASDVTQIGDNADNIGDLDDLTTTVKTDLVSAINEIVSKVQSRPIVTVKTRTSSNSESRLTPSDVESAGFSLPMGSYLVTVYRDTSSSLTYFIGWVSAGFTFTDGAFYKVAGEGTSLIIDGNDLIYNGGDISPNIEVTWIFQPIGDSYTDN